MARSRRDRQAAAVASDDNDTLATALGAVALGVGVLGALSPSLFRGMYGVSDDSAEATYLVRLFSTRNLVFGALALTATGPEERKRIATASCALNALDVTIGLTTTSEGVGGRTRMLGVLTSAVFAAGGAVVARRA